MSRERLDRRARVEGFRVVDQQIESRKSRLLFRPGVELLSE
jgi:hypothetical protein